jgi:hypothetical protein
MKKIAVFVEGQTESIFLSEMIKQIFGEKNVVIKTHRMRQTYGKVRTETITTDTQEEYFFLIFDCGTDGKVKSNIIDNYDKLQQKDYQQIIGLQDLFNPQRMKKDFDNEKFKKNSNNGLPTEIPTKIYFAIQEIEAWFMAEEKHYSAISPDLSMEVINSIAGINIQVETTEKIRHPSVVLDVIYKRGGRKHGYSKNEYAVKDIVSKLDYENLYLNVRNRNNSLNELLTCLDGLIP